MVTDSDSVKETTFDKIIQFQNRLISLSISSSFEGGNTVYQERQFFGVRSDIKAKLPDFAWRCRDLSQV
jgi:hypothetical protein